MYFQRKSTRKSRIAEAFHGRIGTKHSERRVQHEPERPPLSDWITHIGVAYGPGRGLFKQHLRLVLLGAVLPDAGTPFVVLANIVQAYPGVVESYMQPLQAPLPTLLFAATVALLTPTFGRSFLALALGVLTHYILDLSQIRYGGGIYLLYPLNFWSPSMNLYWPETAINLILLGLGTVGTAWALMRPGPRISWQWHRAKGAFLPAALAFALPLFTQDAFLAANANNTAFFRNPHAFEGRLVTLAKMLVTHVEPAPEGGTLLTVRKGKRFLTIQVRAFESWGRVSTGTPPLVNRRVSVKGVFRKARVEATEVAHVHFRPLRTWTSLVGLILLGILVLPDSRFRKKESG